MTCALSLHDVIILMSEHSHPFTGKLLDSTLLQSACRSTKPDDHVRGGFFPGSHPTRIDGHQYRRRCPCTWVSKCEGDNKHVLRKPFANEAALGLLATVLGMTGSCIHDELEAKVNSK